MLYRKIEMQIETHLKSNSNKILLVDEQDKLEKLISYVMSEKNYL